MELTRYLQTCYDPFVSPTLALEGRESGVLFPSTQHRLRSYRNSLRRANESRLFQTVYGEASVIELVCSPPLNLDMGPRRTKHADG